MKPLCTGYNNKPSISLLQEPCHERRHVGCAEWLAWRCGISLSAAREKVRTAQALRTLPEISAAFADGRLSYSKVRALTRVAHIHDEDLLLAYALQATAAQVEERCRQIRNVTPESVHGAHGRSNPSRFGATKRTGRCGSLSRCRSRRVSSSRERRASGRRSLPGVEPDAPSRVARAASGCAGSVAKTSRWRRRGCQWIDGRSLPSRRARG